MNIASKLDSIIKDLGDSMSDFDEAQTLEEQESAINSVHNMISLLNSYGNIKESNLKQRVEIVLNKCKVALSKMENRRGSFPEIETNGPSNNSDRSNKDNKESFNDIIIMEKPNVKWSDVGGLENAKESLKESLILPLKYPDFFKGNVKPWKGILLYGPPGTGKTFLAKACATECDVNFFSISSSDIMSKYMGESEKLVKKLFEEANKRAPSIIFIDEIDSMCGVRAEGENESSRRVKTEFMIQMQGVGHSNERVLVLGATNLPWALDPAISRRFERRVYIPLPDVVARECQLRNKLRSLDSLITDEQYIKVSEMTEGFSGSDLDIVCRNAAYAPLIFAQNSKWFKRIEKNGKIFYCPSKNDQGQSEQLTIENLPFDSLLLPEITDDDLLEAVSKTKPSVSQNDIKVYLKYNKEYGISE